MLCMSAEKNKARAAENITRSDSEVLLVVLAVLGCFSRLATLWSQ